jgi:hypothetical protein
MRAHRIKGSEHLENFMITLLFNYCCSFLFIPGEATIPLRQSNARSYESNYAARGVQTPIETVARGREHSSVGRKPRRLWSVRPSVTLPHASGLSHSLPADKYCIGVRLDWLIHQQRYLRPTPVGRGSECCFLLSPGMQSRDNAGSLKTCVPRSSHKPKSL